MSKPVRYVSDAERAHMQRRAGETDLPLEVYEQTMYGHFALLNYRGRMLGRELLRALGLLEAWDRRR